MTCVLSRSRLPFFVRHPFVSVLVLVSGGMTRQFIIRNRKSGLFDFVRVFVFCFSGAANLFILFYFDMKVRADRTDVCNSLYEVKTVYPFYIYLPNGHRT